MQFYHMAKEDTTKTTIRIPKTLLKKLKQFGLDHDKTLTEITLEAYNEYLERRGQKRNVVER